MSDENPDVLFNNLAGPRPVDWEVDSVSLQTKGVFVSGPGILTLRGRAAQIFLSIDKEIRAFALQLDAEEFVLPSSLSVLDLRRCGNLTRFPQLTKIMVPLDRAIAEPPLPLTEFDRACCSAVCLSSFPHFSEKIFDDGLSITMTASGKIVRNEILKVENYERLTEFHLREIIFMGSQHFVNSSLNRCLEWLENLLTECHLRGSIQSAEDPFFGHDAETLRSFQKATKSKYELQLQKPKSGEMVPVASLNKHGHHFAKSYNIRNQDGDLVYSGCFGVGLERLLLLLFAQHGLDETVWPVTLRNRFGR